MGCGNSKYKLSKHDLTFLIENTEFSKQQIKTWYKGFIVDCPSGELSKTKFIEVYQQLFPQGDAQKFCSHIFRTFDTDNSGKIDFKEFLMAINITAKGDPEKKLKWVLIFC
jgi:Ca2+-binding EF-hand superfamily protein